MIKARIPTALMLFLLSGAVARSEPQSINDTGKLAGRVTGWNNSPLADAFIYLHDADGEERANSAGRTGDIKATVDGSGRFEARLSPTYYDVFVASPLYLPDCRVIHIEAGKTTEMTVKLELDKSFNDSGGDTIIIPDK